MKVGDRVSDPNWGEWTHMLWISSELAWKFIEEVRELSPEVAVDLTTKTWPAKEGVIVAKVVVEGNAICYLLVVYYPDKMPGYQYDLHINARLISL